MKKRRVVILGSTGSIGTSALKVAAALPERMEIVGLAAHSSVDVLARQIAETGVKRAVIFREDKKDELTALAGSDVAISTGLDGLCELATMEEADMVLVSIIGTDGLKPALAAIRAGKDLAIASKEILVMAGEVIMKAAAESGVNILPVDSEHNAIFQCLQGHGGEDRVKRLLLTASGGPFRRTPAEELCRVTAEQALRHPVWKMGKKITIDSASMFNKGLEMIEARWLFGIPMDRVDVVVHPQSVVHSLVEFVDGSLLAQLSSSDMCFPIQYAVTWPDRVPSCLEPLNLATLGKLEFEEPRWDDFPALGLARHAGTVGGTMPAVLNAANEVAVASFMKAELSFPGIWETVAQVMERHDVMPSHDLDVILVADAWARTEAAKVIRRARIS